MSRLSIAGAAGGELLVQAGETLLAAAHRQHWQAMAGCRNGACLSCRAELVAGCASDRAGNRLAIGAILTCQTIPCGDLQLIWPGATAPGSASAARRLSCRILATGFCDGGWRSRLQLPAGRTVTMLPGQYFVIVDTDDEPVQSTAGIAPSTTSKTPDHRLWLLRPTGGADRELLLLSGQPLPTSGRTPGVGSEPRLVVEGPFGHCWLDRAVPAPVHLLADRSRDLQAMALDECCAAWGLARDGIAPGTVLVLSDSPEQRAAWRARWYASAAVYADDDMRHYGMRTGVWTGRQETNDNSQTDGR